MFSAFEKVTSLDTHAVITAVGTGIKKVLFFDLRAGRFDRREETGIILILEIRHTCYVSILSFPLTSFVFFIVKRISGS